MMFGGEGNDTAVVAGRINHVLVQVVTALW